MKKLVFISDINLNESPKVRSCIRDDVVEEYAALYRSKERMPEPRLFWDGATKTMMVADGLHRISAAKAMKLKALPCEVTNGTYEDCLKHALLANQTHGLRRSNQDKTESVITALKTWPDISNVQLSKIAGVADTFVGDVRKKLEQAGKLKEAPVRKGADGRSQKSTRSTSTSVGPMSNGEKPKKNEFFDDTGYPIPSNLWTVWSRKDEPMEVLNALSGIKSVLKKAQENDDALWREVNFSTAIGDLEKAWTSIQCAVPYAVCTVCQGHPELQPKEQCRMCKSRGMLSKFRYDRTVPDEIKKVREAGLKK